MRRLRLPSAVPECGGLARRRASPNTRVIHSRKPWMITTVQVWQVIAGLVVAGYFLWSFVNVVRAAGCSDLCGVSSAVTVFISAPAFLLGASLVVSGLRLGRPTARGSRTTSLIIHGLTLAFILISLPSQVEGASSYGFSAEGGRDFLLSAVGLCVTGFAIYAIGLSRRARKYYGLLRRSAEQ